MATPRRITFYCRKPDSDGVHPTFPVDSEAKHDTAKSWAKSSRYNYGNDKDYEPTVHEYENTGFDFVRIDSLDIRGEGGRAYQVIIERDGHKFQVDMREATLMDVIKNTGIEAGGKLNGSFCFNKAGSQTQLIREGSEVHKKAMEEQEIRETYTKTISTKDLKPGYRYSSPSGKDAIYLGAVYTANNAKLKEGEVKIAKHLLWVSYGDEKVKSYLTTGERPTEKHNEIRNWYFDLTTSHSYKIEGEKELDVDMETVLPRITVIGTEGVEEVKGRSYISYPENFTDPYRLSIMKSDRKEVTVDEKFVKDQLDKQNRRGYRW